MEATKNELARSNAEHTAALVRVSADMRALAIESVKSAVELQREELEVSAQQEREHMEMKLKRQQEGLVRENEALKKELDQARGHGSLLSQRLQEEKFEQRKNLAGFVRVRRTLEKLETEIIEDFFFDAVETLPF